MESNSRIQNNLKFEEKTNALTPDKMDRSMRGKNVGYKEMPYPLTEEEATPTVSESEKEFNPKRGTKERDLHAHD